MGSFHIQYHLWAIQHVVGHHVHTNIIGYDPDMHHFTQVEEKAAPGYRSHVNHEYLPKYQRFWKFALWFQTGATTVALALLNVPKYLEERKMQTTKPSVPKKTQHRKNKGGSGTRPGGNR